MFQYLKIISYSGKLCQPKIQKAVYSHLSKRFCSSAKPKNHYEILNLSKNCTSKEIKDAFIELSKKHHPDKNKNNPKAKEEFVKINEAYNVLIKPQSRQTYDNSLFEFGKPTRIYRYGDYEVHRYDPWQDPSFARNRKFSEEDIRKSEENYYGIRGLRRVSNEKFLTYLLIFVVGTIVLQLIIIRFAVMGSIHKAREYSKRNQKLWDEAVERSKLDGYREWQIEQMKLQAEYYSNKQDKAVKY